MKKTLLALSLLGCLLLSAVACTNNENESDTGTRRWDVDGNVVLGQPDNKTEEEDTPGNVDDEGGIGNAGANTEDQWGPIQPVK